MRCPNIQFETQTRRKYRNYRTLTYLERQYLGHTQRKINRMENKIMHEKMKKTYGRQDNRSLWNNCIPLCRRRLIKSTNYSGLCDEGTHAHAHTHTDARARYLSRFRAPMYNHATQLYTE